MTPGVLTTAEVSTSLRTRVLDSILLSKLAPKTQNHSSLYKARCTEAVKPKPQQGHHRGLPATLRLSRRPQVQPVRGLSFGSVTLAGFMAGFWAKPMLPCCRSAQVHRRQPLGWTLDSRHLDQPAPGQTYLALTHFPTVPDTRNQRPSAALVHQGSRRSTWNPASSL